MCPSSCGHCFAPLSVCLYTCACLPNLHTSAYNLIIRCSPSPSITPTNSKHSRATGKQHYLGANPSHGVRQLQTLHVTPPCHLHYTHTSMHTHGDTPPRSRTTLHSFSPFHLSPSLSLPLCMSFSVTRLVQNCTEASCHSIEE